VIVSHHGSLTGTPRRAASGPAAPKTMWGLQRRLAIVLVIAVAAGAGIVIPHAVASAAPTTTLVVNSTDWGGPDANPGDGVCETAPGNGVCTLRAAIEESNALNGAPGDVVITVDPSIPLNTPMTGIPNVQANFMLNNPSPTINRQDVRGAQYNVTAPVTIDLGHRLQANGSVNDNNENAMFYLNGPDIQLLNADHVLSSGSSFVIGPNANRVKLDGDTLGVNDGFGRVYGDANYYPERFVVIMQGAQNVTVTNYQVHGYYDSNDDGGIFVFANPSTASTAPTNVTRNIMVDRVQVNYVKNGSCTGSDGSGCNTRLVNFWNGTTSGTWGNSYTNNVISGLTFQNMVVQNKGSGPYGFQFSHPDGSVSTYSADITDLVIRDNQFLNNAASSTFAYYAFITLPYAKNLHGTNLISGNVFTSNNATGSQTGQATAIFFLGSEPDGSTTPSNLTITSNHFNGYGNYSAVRTRSTGLVTVTGNTFGPATRAYANATEETNSDYVMYSFSSTWTPYRSANQAILTWAPVAGNATVLTSPLTSGVLAMTDPRDGAYPTCTATVKVTKPTAIVGNTTIPADPVTLQAYWTSAQTAEVYLGQVSGVVGPDATVAFPLPVGTLTLPDGTTAKVVDPVSGVASGYVRFQTHVEGLGQLESSQYSRTVPLTGTCRPVLTINQAAGMTDPTSGRDLHFTLTSTVPLDPDTVTPGVIGLTATAVQQTIDAARLNPRIVSVTPVAGSGDTVFDVIVRVDDSATVTVTVAADAVATPTGMTNQGPATSTDDSITFLNPLKATPPQFTLVTGEPVGKDFTISVTAGAPLPAADLAFTATVDQPAGTPLVTLSTTGPLLRAGQTSTDPVTVKAAAGAVAANTAAPITLTVASADPNYDGLVVPGVTAFLFSTDPTIQITKTVYTNVTDASSPAQIEATGTLAPSGARLMDRQAVCFVYTVANTSSDDWATSLSDVTVTDSDTRLGVNGVIGTIPTLAIGQSVKLAACTSLLPVDTTVTNGTVQ